MKATVLEPGDLGDGTYSNESPHPHVLVGGKRLTLEQAQALAQELRDAIREVERIAQEIDD